MEGDLTLDDLAALLDEEDDELFAMIDGDTGDVQSDENSCKDKKTKLVKNIPGMIAQPNPLSHSVSEPNTLSHSVPKDGANQDITDNATKPDPVWSSSLTSSQDCETPQKNGGRVSSVALQRIESDLALSDEEATPEPAPADDEDDPSEAEIRALEEKLARLKGKKQSKSSPKDLQEVVSRIKKPPTPNKSQFIDTTGLVASSVVRGPPPTPAAAQPGTSLEERVRALLSRPQSHVHSGDTDSSEDEDNRTPFERRYSEFGRQVKRLAHGAASSAARDQLQQRAEHVNRAAKRALRPKVAARPAQGGRPAVPEQPHQEVMLDSFARMSVINSRLTDAELRDCMQEKRLIRVSQLESHIRGETIPGDWVTVGVIARKSESRTSQKGSAYSSWTLTDLIDCQKPAKVMLFGDAHSALWKTTVGTVVALAGCKVMKEREMNGSGITIALNSSQQCILLGTSPDLDFCKAKCKNGRVCLSFINKRHCSVCVFHMNAEYKKTGAKRGELQAQSCVAPRRSFKQQLGGGDGGGGPLLHEGQLAFISAGRHSETAAQKLRDRQRLASLRLQKQCEESLSTKKKLSTLGLKHISEVEAKAIASVAEDSVEMGEMLLKPCAGARNLLKHLTKDSAGSAASSDLAEPAAARRPALAPSALLQAEARRQADSRLPPPRLARNVAPGHQVELELSPGDRRNCLSKAKALAILRQSGGVKKANPNAVRSRPSEQRRQDVLKRVPERADETAPAAVEATEPASKRCRLADDPKFRAILEARSSHASALEAELTEGQEHYFQALEKKEMIENKMLNTWEVKTKAVYCKKCKYRALSASELCKSEGHATVLVDAVKRFFSCKNCKNRTISLDKFPKLPCKNCGQETWQKAAMGKERSGPKLDSEILSIRGNEATFLHSHVQDHNIHLEF